MTVYNQPVNNAVIYVQQPQQPIMYQQPMMEQQPMMGEAMPEFSDATPKQM